MDWTIISIAVSAIATCFIAYYSYISTCLAKELKNQDKTYRDRLENLTKQHQDELSDLYQAIVIATLMSGNSNAGKVRDSIHIFRQHYKGGTRIFNEDDKG